MLEAQLLTEMNEGRLRIDPITLDVYVLHGGWGKWHRKALQRHPKSGRARFMFGKARTPVYRNRLVWIWMASATILYRLACFRYKEKFSIPRIFHPVSSLFVQRIFAPPTLPLATLPHASMSGSKHHPLHP